MGTSLSTYTNKSTRPTVSLSAFRESVGQSSWSDWITIDQAMIHAFAQATGDTAFIHTDPDRARRTRFKGTIAHGLLILSRLPHMMASATPIVEEVRMGVNYGYDRVRFLKPVPVDSRLRGRFTLDRVSEAKAGFVQVVYDVAVELEGEEKPALVARWTLGRWLRRVDRPLAG